jgi:hypothetical protein
MANSTRIYTTPLADVYPHYIKKAEKHGRTKDEVDLIITWLTGYSACELQQHINMKTDFEQFFACAPQINPAASLITGVICGHRIEEIDDMLMRNIRRLDKMIDELAKGKAIDKILRK